MKFNSEWAQVDGLECRQTSEKAILVVNQGGDEWWVPKSQIHPSSPVMRKDDEGTLYVKSWFADKEAMGGIELYDDAF